MTGTVTLDKPMDPVVAPPIVDTPVAPPVVAPPIVDTPVAPPVVTSNMVMTQTVADDLFTQFKLKLLGQKCDTPDALIHASLKVVNDSFPREILAKTDAQMGNPAAIVNQLQNLLFIKDGYSHFDKHMLIQFKAAITTLNGCLLRNVPLSDPRVPLIYEVTVEIVSQSLQYKG